jgi:hypothetical protein
MYVLALLTFRDKNYFFRLSYIINVYEFYAHIYSLWGKNLAELLLLRITVSY